MKQNGYIHIYTGNGKGKTTAAFGLAVRALCSGKNVFIGQFVKSMKYHETGIEPLFCGNQAVEAGFGRIRIEQLGRGCFIGRDADRADIEMAERGFRKCMDEIRSGKWDVVILDELTIALHFGLLKTEDVVTALQDRESGSEIVITGRYAPMELIDMADLVTEMKEIRHYYTRGVLSRDGIDR